MSLYVVTTSGFLAFVNTVGFVNKNINAGVGPSPVLAKKIPSEPGENKKYFPRGVPAVASASPARPGGGRMSNELSEIIVFILAQSRGKDTIRRLVNCEISQAS